MDWRASTWWWLASGGLVAVELATGTFYLLMLALGAAAGAVAAHAGAPFVGQLLAAAVMGGGAVAAWHQRRSRQPAQPAASANPDINLDIGSPVHVGHWRADGTARVNYRGAGWDARYAGTGAPAAGPHVIRAIDGTHLVLDRPAG